MAPELLDMNGKYEIDLDTAEAFMREMPYSLANGLTPYDDWHPEGQKNFF